VQLPAQQSDEQGCPSATQSGGIVHCPPAHAPVQQSEATAQGPARSVQAGPPASEIACTPFVGELLLQPPSDAQVAAKHTQVAVVDCQFAVVI
jgi:hypothetical protein